MTAVDPAIRASVEHLGVWGTTVALGDAGLTTAEDRLAGLPALPIGGAETLRRRIADAVRDLCSRFPVDQIIIAPDQVVLDLVTKHFNGPVAVMLPSDSALEIEEHFHGFESPQIEIERAPQLPRPRGTLPALVLLGKHGPANSYIAPNDKLLLDLFAERVLGLTILIDPSDNVPDYVEGRVSVWTRRFRGIYNAALIQTNAKEQNRD